MKQLFFSVYVDDLKMAAKKENLAPMWKLMSKSIELEPAKAMTVSQYSGCAQKEIEPEEEDIERMSAASEVFSVKRGDCSAQVAHPELRKSQGEVLSTDGKVFDEAHSENIELHLNTKSEGNSSQREGQTSRGNQRLVRDVLMHSNMRVVPHGSEWYEAMHTTCKAMRRQA